MNRPAKSSSTNSALREQLIHVLRGDRSHLSFDQAVRGFPRNRVGARPKGSPHSAWELLEHMRIAQEDILRFCQSGDYVSPPWPEGYWPKSPAPERAAQWAVSVRRYRQDLAEFEALIADPARNLFRRIPWGDGQTLLQEALVLGNHNSYHLGQLLLVRRLVEG